MRRLSAFCLALSLPITYSVSSSVHAQAKNSNKTSVFQQVGGTTAEGAGGAGGAGGLFGAGGNGGAGASGAGG